MNPFTRHAYEEWRRYWTLVSVIGGFLVLLLRAWEGRYLATVLATILSTLVFWLLGLMLPRLLMRKGK